jgi:hypothetical protein
VHRRAASLKAAGKSSLPCARADCTSGAETGDVHGQRDILAAG